MPLIASYTNYTLQPVQWPKDARTEAGIFAANLTLAAGTVVAKVTSGGKLAAYNDSNSDGTQVAVGLLAVAIKTDANGKVYVGGSTTAGPLNPPLDTAPYFICGTFDTDDLTGWDAAAATDLHARTLPTGYVKIP